MPQRAGKPIAVIGGGINGAATAEALARELRAQHSKQEVILFDLFGLPDPAVIANSSGGDTRITRIANAEHPALTYTAIDTIRHYSNLRRVFSTTGDPGLLKVKAMLDDRYGGDMFYKPCGFTMIMPRVRPGETPRPFHGKQGNALELTTNNARENSVDSEMIRGGAEIQRRFPGFKINDAETDAYYEPPAPEDADFNERQPTGGILFAERCVASHMAMFQYYGGIYRPRTKVKAIGNDDDGGITLTLADDSTISASKAVVAAGKWINDLLPHFKIKPQRNVVGFFKGRDPAILSADSGQPMPSFIVYFRTKDNTVDYAYGIPATDDSFAYPGFFKAARENGAFGGLDVTRALKGELKSLFNFTQDFAHIHDPRRARSLVCFYSITEDSRPRWANYPFLRNVFFIVNCDGGGFKHGAGGARPMARMMLDMPSNNPNVDLRRDFGFMPVKDPVMDPNPQLDRAIAAMTKSPRFE